jgi:hypothetical protein
MSTGSFVSALVLLLSAAPLAGAQQAPATVPPTPAALSVPNPLAGFRPGPRDLYQLPDGSDRFQHPGPYPVPTPPIFIPPGGYVPSPYYPYYPYYVLTEHLTPSRQKPMIEHGGLVLDSVPDSAQVFVDGFYVGIAEEFGLLGRPLTVTAGTHRVELRAPGYETILFSARIDPNQILRYRGEMQLLARPPVVFVPAQPAAAKSLYVIPKCYAGDKPPTGALPPGCDRKNLQTHK